MHDPESFGLLPSEYRRVAALLSKLPKSKCLWPARYRVGTAETAYEFLLELRTWNEAEGEIQPLPDREYLREYVKEWWEAWRGGRTLCIEKCRRMVISWAARGLELYVMGLSRLDGLIGGEDYEASAKHCWRYRHLYTDMRARHPDWKLPKHSELKFRGDRQLQQFSLANGSSVSILNGMPKSIQGDGVRFVTLEEFGLYSAPASMLAQAKIVTQGRAGQKGFVNLITNASVDEQWQLVKRGGLDISQKPELAAVLNGLEATDLRTGMRYLKLHHYADPGKDMDWLAQVREEMMDTPRDFRLQILMDDTEDEDALWNRSDVDSHRITMEAFDEIELLKVVVAIDPATKSTEGNDETGIVVAGLGRMEGELHAFVMRDLSGKHPPDKVARLAVALAQRYGASEIVYEANQGGDWIRSLINSEWTRQQILLTVPLNEVHAFRGKLLRAEPVAAKYRMGMVHHVDQDEKGDIMHLARLESQMVRWNPLADKQSPDRLDALVIAITALYGKGVGLSRKSDVYRRRGRG